MLGNPADRPDQGIRIIIQGNGSSVAVAIEDFLRKYNERNPDKNVIHLNYAAIDPILTNEKCSYWHFAWDAAVNIKLEARRDILLADLCTMIDQALAAKAAVP